jgi:hypothetical protein
MKRRLAVPFIGLAAALLNPTTTLARDDAEVRKELEAQYRRLAEAHDRRDLEAIVALKTTDFHAISPDGKVGDSKTMKQYSRQFLDTNQPPYHIRVTIQKLTVSEYELIAVAEVFQEATRYRELEGKRRRVDTSVLQRETWAKGSGGWKLKLVDNVRDQKRFVDGKRVDPSKPYDPSALPYDPDRGGTNEP